MSSRPATRGSLARNGWDLVCWDLDGVIADSSRAIPTCINLALAEFALPPRRHEELRGYIGPPLLETFGILFEEEGVDPGRAREAVEAYRRHYATESIRSTTSYPGIVELLAGLEGRLRLLVVTSKPVDAAAPILDALGVRQRFESIHAPALDDLQEPKTETLRMALEAAGFRPGQSGLMIGDRLHDIIAGKANGIATAAVLWGFGSREELVAERPDHLLATVPELEVLLRTGP